MAIQFTFKKITWLCDTDTGKLTNKQGLIYIAPKGNGMTHPGTHTDLTPEEAFEKRYRGQASSILNDWNDIELYVYEQDEIEKIDHDENIRGLIYKHHSKGLIPFSAYSKKINPAPTGTNNEALIDYDHTKHSNAYLEVIKEYFGLALETDLRDPWIPRDAGTPYGQDLMVNELADKLSRHSHVGFNGHTGLAKTMIAAAVVQTKLFPTGGALVLFTSPISDTLTDVENNFCNFYYKGSDRTRKVVLYKEDILNKKSFLELRKEADNGAFVVLAATVQDIRYQDDASCDDKELRDKYKDLLSIRVDAFIRDEVQTNYGGAVTAEVLGQVSANAGYVIDTSASINKLSDMYPQDAIVDRGLFWALQYEKERGTPHIHIESLSGLAYDMLDPSVKDMYDEEEGWTPAKMTEQMPNGQLRSLIAIDQILTLQYISDDDKEDNPLSIINDLDLPFQSRRIGIHVFPQGVKGTPAGDYLIQLANDVNSMPKWNSGKVIFITPYDFVKHARSLKRQDYKEVIEDLSKEYEHVIIFTHRMWTVGSNIPPLAHVVQWDAIRDPYNQEQLYPGRAYRVLPWKTDIKIYDLAPGHTLESAFSHLAKITAKLNKSNPDPRELLKNINFKHYIKNIGVVSHSVEEVYANYNNNLLNRVKATPPIDKIAMALGAVDIANLKGSDIDDNHELGKGSQTDLTEDNNVKKFEWQESDGKGIAKGQPKTIGPVALAKKINSVMLELPAFAVLNKLFLIEDALSHWAIEKMFGQKNVDLLLDIVKNNTQLKNVMQDWLTDIHQAYQSLPFEELHDYVFKNTKKKKETGLVFINNESAKDLTDKFISTFNLPKAYTGIIAVENALSGSWPFYLQKHFNDAKIVCIETHEYYTDHLRSMGFKVISNKDLDKEEYMKKIKYWLLNPPYQKDAEGQNDESNKQGSFWFEFVKEVLTSPASSSDAKAMVVSPKSIFGAGGFGRATYKVNQIREHAEFVHIWPDLSNCFPGVGIEICGYAIDKDKTNTDVTLDGSQRVITVDGTVPTPFHVSVTAAEVLKNCWSKPNIAFSESISANDTDLVLKVNGGRYKVWKKTFVGFNKDTEHNQQGAKLNIAEILGYQSAVKSKLWEYIFKILGGEKGNSVTGLMKYMPIMPDMTKSYTDDEWFTAFNITLKMQDDINQYLKDYK
jgi:hypothetical protein